MTAEMKITALAPWFGGKRMMADTIVSQFGPHAAYWEPFCGSMAVLMQKPEASHEHVNDLHGDLINLARVIQNSQQGSELYRRLRRTLHHQGFFEEARKRWMNGWTNGESAVDQAYWYFIVSWMGRNGVAGTRRCNYTYATRYTPHGGHGGVRFGSAVDSIPKWRERMRRVTILQKDALEIVEKIEDYPGTLIYADPPYIDEGGEYLHSLTVEQHRQLARLLCSFQHARIVISYYQHDSLTTWYPGWMVVDCARHKNMTGSMKRGKARRDAPEVLLINGPSFEDSGERTLF